MTLKQYFLADFNRTSNESMASAGTSECNFMLLTDRPGF